MSDNDRKMFDRKLKVSIRHLLEIKICGAWLDRSCSMRTAVARSSPRHPSAKQKSYKNWRSKSSTVERDPFLHSAQRNRKTQVVDLGFYL